MKIFGLTVDNIKCQTGNIKLKQGLLLLNDKRLGEWYEKVNQPILFIPKETISKKKLYMKLNTMSYCIPTLKIIRKKVSFDELIGDLIRGIDIDFEYYNVIDFSDIKCERKGEISFEKLSNMSDQEVFELSLQKNDKGLATTSAIKATKYRRKKTHAYDYDWVSKSISPEATYYQYHGKFED